MPICLLIRALPKTTPRPICRIFSRTLSRYPPALAKAPMPPRPKVNEAEIEESFLKGSGPGGQKINKTSSAVQLRHLPTGIVVKSQSTRSRPQNRKIARRILAEKIEELEKGSESRTAKIRDRDRKKKASKTKKAKRKYSKLEAEKAGSEVDLESGEEEEQGGEDEEEVWEVVKEEYNDDIAIEEIKEEQKEEEAVEDFKTEIKEGNTEVPKKKDRRQRKT